MIEEMELKRQRIDKVLALLSIGMSIDVSGIGIGKVTCIYAYGLDVRVRMDHGQSFNARLMPTENGEYICSKI